MCKLNEVPMQPSKFTDDELVEFSKKNNPKPWRLTHHKTGRGYSKCVLVDAANKVIGGRSALVRICRLINTVEG